MQMITLPWGVTNSIPQFVWIIFKILAPHLQDWGKLFLDNIVVKGRKTKYNEEKVTLEIWRSVLKHMENLNMVLLDLEKARVTIMNRKSQFC